MQLIGFSTYTTAIATSTNSSYTGFDRDLIGRARVRLVPVELPEGDGAFDPSTLAAFEAKMDELAAEGVRVRAVVSSWYGNPQSFGTSEVPHHRGNKATASHKHNN